MNTTTIQIDKDHPVVSRLIELQASDSDRTFSRDWLSVSETTWFRIKTNSYKADDHSKALEKLTSDLAKLLDHIALTSGKVQPILPLSHISESRKALNIAFGEDRNRLIITLADTGGGKTTIVKSICRDFPGRVAPVEATETWRHSYLAGLHGIGAACGILDLPSNSRRAEQLLLTELMARPRIILIDEGNYFGPACLNLVKAILNNSSSVIGIYALPVFWNFITRSSLHEARQLRNRTAAMLQFDSVKDSDVRLALSKSVPGWDSLNGSAAAAATLVRKAANSFGLWNTVFSAANFIADESNGAPITLEMVERAVTDISRLRR